MSGSSSKTNQTSFQDIRYSHNPNLRPIIALKPTWKTTFTYSPISSEVTEVIKSAVSNLLIEANNVGDEESRGWQRFECDKGIKAHKKIDFNSAPQLSLKARGTIDTTPKKLYEVLTTKSRSEWDKLCKESQKLEKVDNFTDVSYSQYEAAACLIRIPRDVLYISRWFETDSGGYICAAASIKHSSCPEKDGIVRMHVYPSGWIIHPISENPLQTELIFMNQLDLKVNYFPPVFLNNIITNQALCVYRAKQIVKRELQEYQMKMQSLDLKFGELISLFENDEQCINFLLKRFQQKNSKALVKAIESFQNGSSVVVEVQHEVFEVPAPSQEQLQERGRSRSNSFSEQVTFSAHAESGARVMEDTHSIISQEIEGSKIHFFGIFDGHFGDFAANYCKEFFHSTFFKVLGEISDIPKAIEQSFASIESVYLAEATKKQNEAGTTALIAIIKNNKLYVGCAGDSEAVLCRKNKAMLMSEIHTPRNPAELARVKKAGGTVHSNNKLSHPVWNPNIINLGVTRAIGDIYFKLGQFTENKNTGLISNPFIMETTVSNGDDFLVLASDGLWSVLKHQEVVDFVQSNIKNKLELNQICKKLVDVAMSKGCSDNVTVIIILF